MDILLSVPEELSLCVLSEWFSLKDLARLDQAYLCHKTRAKLLALATNTYRALEHDSNTLCSPKAQLTFIRWLVSRNIRVKHLFIPVAIQSDVKLMSDLFHLCGSSLRTVRLQNDAHLKEFSLLSELMIEHCGSLEELSVTEFPDNLDFLRVVSLHCPHIRKLTFRNCFHYKGDKEKDLNFSVLRTFESSGASLSDNFLNALAMCSPLLEELKLEKGYDITPRGLQSIAERCSLLHTVSLSGATATDAHLHPIVRLCKNLRTVNITNGYWDEFSELSLIRIAHYCPLLTTLRLDNCCGATTDDIKDVLEHCKELRVLTILSCTDVNIEATLHSIARFCPLLTHLNMQCRCMNYDECLRAVARSCPNLQEVTLTSSRRFINFIPRNLFGPHVEVLEVVDRKMRCSHYFE